MPWLEHHKLSERLASEAQVASLHGRQDEALILYAQAADAEVKALDDLDPSKVRTAGISAVSAASLYYKAADFERSADVVLQWLGDHTLPGFAKKQLGGLLLSIWCRTPAAAGVGSDMRDHLVTRTTRKAAPKLLSHVIRAGIPADALVRSKLKRRVFWHHKSQRSECFRSSKLLGLSSAPLVLSRNDVEAA